MSESCSDDYNDRCSGYRNMTGLCRSDNSWRWQGVARQCHPVLMPHSGLLMIHCGSLVAAAAVAGLSARRSGNSSCLRACECVPQVDWETMWRERLADYARPQEGKAALGWSTKVTVEVRPWGIRLCKAGVAA
jgi:hypothetical protein